MTVTTDQEQPGTATREEHPTRALLLATTVDLLDTVPVERLQKAMVLEASGVSHGSLYHHFEDFPDLVEHALAVRYGRRTIEANEAIRLICEQARDAAEFRSMIEAMIRENHQPHRAQNRMERIQVLALLPTRPRLAAMVAREQQAITDFGVEILREPQRKGWIRADTDLEALVVMTQALTTGRVVDDRTERPIDPERWIDLMVHLTCHVAFGD